MTNLISFKQVRGYRFQHKQLVMNSPCIITPMVSTTYKHLFSNIFLFILLYKCAYNIKVKSPTLKVTILKFNFHKKHSIKSKQTGFRNELMLDTFTTFISSNAGDYTYAVIYLITSPTLRNLCDIQNIHSQITTE